MTCTHCQCAEKLFDDKGARRELKSYHKKGPKAVTRKLIALLLPRVKAGNSLLDIGGGIGAIQLAALEAGAEKVTDVDASGGYLAVAAEESRRKGYGEKVSYRYGDFLDLADGIEKHDIVTLDKVICCYPDYRGLLSTAAGKAGKTLAVVFPRDMWLVKLVMGLGNMWLRFRGSAFRVYPHPSAQVFELIEMQGLRKVASDHHRAWQIVVFERAG
jgi:magnesium-protoporphyrin O-methyltransferase